jgi:hypothetical protein
VDAAALERLHNFKPRVAEHVDHRLVFVQGLGFETDESLPGRDAGQPLEQQRADAPPLEIVLDQEGDLGLASRSTLQPG